MNVPIWIVIGVRKLDGRDSQNLNNETFSRLSVTSAQCFIGTENYSDADTLLNYDDDDDDDDEYSQGYGPTKEIFRTLTKDDIV